MWVFRCMLSRVTGPCFNPVGPAVLISWLWLLTAFEPSYFQTGNHATFWYSAPKVLYYFLPFKPRHSAFQYQQSPKYPLIFWIIFVCECYFFNPVRPVMRGPSSPFFTTWGNLNWAQPSTPNQFTETENNCFAFALAIKGSAAQIF